MINFPDTEKKLKNRISSYTSALNKELKTHGYINDGAGKRYGLFHLYFVLNDLKKSEKYFEWYKTKFADDVGEPVQKLCWAISLFRMDRQKEARYMLADLMLSNLYILPRILGQKIEKHDIWQFSSDGDVDYFNEIPDAVLNGVTPQDINWIRECNDSFLFRRIKQRYVGIYGQLQTAKDVETRRKLREESETLLDQLK